jgi:hypothetical protein
VSTSTKKPVKKPTEKPSNNPGPGVPVNVQGETAEIKFN